MRGFRVYDKKEKLTIDNPCEKNLFISENGNIINPSHPELHLMKRYIREDSIGQVDKDGIEVFEGDILCQMVGDKPICYVVSWENDKSGFNVGKLNTEISTVVGNIHKDKDLLKTLDE